MIQDELMELITEQDTVTHYNESDIKPGTMEWAENAERLGESIIRRNEAMGNIQAAFSEMEQRIGILWEALIAINHNIIDAEYAYIEGNTSDESIPRDMLRPMFHALYDILRKPLAMLEEDDANPT